MKIGCKFLKNGVQKHSKDIPKTFQRHSTCSSNLCGYVNGKMLEDDDIMSMTYINHSNHDNRDNHIISMIVIARNIKT